MTSQLETRDHAAANATRFRVRVVDHAQGDETTNVTLPIGLVRFGLRMARTFSPKLKGVDIAWDDLLTTVDEGERGEIVHVEDEARHRTVDIFVE